MAPTISKILNLATELNLKTSEDFAQRAYVTLSKFKTGISLKEFEKEISLWLGKNKLPKQLNLYDGFGQPPLTLFNNGQFVIDLYFWTTNDTSIHSHSFSGAFKVLFGKSNHQTYDVEIQSKESEDVLYTKLIPLKKNCIGPDDTIRILPGLDFNHKLEHLDNPTITLCLRTITDQSKSQWHHFENGLSIQKRDDLEPLIKKTSYFNYLFLKNPELASSFLWSELENNSISSLLNFYEILSSSPMGLDDSSLEYFFESFHEKFQNEKWFKIYFST